jgi:hypothetical protein
MTWWREPSRARSDLGRAAAGGWPPVSFLWYAVRVRDKLKLFTGPEQEAEDRRVSEIRRQMTRIRD